MSKREFEPKRKNFSQNQSEEIDFEEDLNFEFPENTDFNEI